MRGSAPGEKHDPFDAYLWEGSQGEVPGKKHAPVEATYDQGGIRESPTRWPLL